MNRDTNEGLPPSGAPDGFLAGSGEMAQRMRAFDWSHTGLGSVERWSAALKTMTSILLANRFPMLLWWGPESISIYNDAYIPVLGVKHPRALGLPVKDCWAEISGVLRPNLLTPLSDSPTGPEDLLRELRRRGFLEEAHSVSACSPVPDETAEGGIGGVLVSAQSPSRRETSGKIAWTTRSRAACSWSKTTRTLLSCFATPCSCAVTRWPLRTTVRMHCRRRAAFSPRSCCVTSVLPGMSGYDVARAFRADHALRHTCLVVLTGYALPEDIRRATDAGFERHLPKPPALDKLEQVLSSARRPP